MDFTFQAFFAMFAGHIGKQQAASGNWQPAAKRTVAFCLFVTIVFVHHNNAAFCTAKAMHAWPQARPYALAKRNGTEGKNPQKQAIFRVHPFDFVSVAQQPSVAHGAIAFGAVHTRFSGGFLAYANRQLIRARLTWLAVFLRRLWQQAQSNNGKNHNHTRGNHKSQGNQK